jgi:phosphate transport system substrate-binding protein
VAVEGISLAVPQAMEGDETAVAKSCLEEMEALTLPQLRWIFSSFSDDELIGDGWDQDSIPNSDGDPTTHLWSELNSACEQVEIRIAGPPVDSDAAKLFQELVFGEKNAETFAVDRPGSFFAGQDSDELADFLVTNSTAAIAFFDIGYILTSLDLASVSSVNVEVDGEVFKPGAKSFEDGTYPLSRILHYFVHNDEDSLEITRSFVDFIFSEDGDDAAKSNGFWPLSGSKKLVMATRMQSALGIPQSLVESYCGPAGASISIAGSSTVYPVADLWAQIYSTFCDVEITVEGGGSSNGAARVCGVESRGSPVDIGDMSREWSGSEAVEHDGFLYECLEGDASRSAIQVEVAIDGLTVAVNHDGVASNCIQILGGLTTDQLRWIYSNYNDNELTATGWDPASVPNNDGDSLTHKWSELHEGCSNTEIEIAGPDDRSGTYEYFLETIFLDHDNGETFDVFRPGFSYFNSEDDDVLVDYVYSNPEAIAFFGYNYYFENRDSLESVAIRNRDGVFLKPIPETIGDGSYNPLARRIYMNLLNAPEVLENTIPLVQFGLENPAIVAYTGYVAIPEDQADKLIATRLENAPFSISNDEENSGLSTGAVVGIVVGSIVGLCLVVGIMYKCMRGRDKGEAQEAAP